MMTWISKVEIREELCEGLWVVSDLSTWWYESHGKKVDFVSLDYADSVTRFLSKMKRVKSHIDSLFAEHDGRGPG